MKSSAGLGKPARTAFVRSGTGMGKPIVMPVICMVSLRESDHERNMNRFEAFRIAATLVPKGTFQAGIRPGRSGDQATYGTRGCPAF